MQYRKMGRLNWEVSTLSFGGMRLPTLNSYNEIDFGKASEMVHHAIEQGVNYFDTAWMYHKGNSEAFFGKALRGGFREKVKLVTKSPIWLIDSKSVFHDFFKQQLARLNNNYIDNYLFHALDKKRWEKAKKLGLLEEMIKLKESGKIRHIGFSFHGSPDTFREIIDAYDWDMTQIQYNYLDTDFQATTKGLDYAYSKGIAVVIMEPLRGGKLTQHNSEIDGILDTATEKKDLIEWAIHFILNHPGVSTVLSGMSTLEQLKQNISYANSFSPAGLSANELNTIEKLRTSYEKKIKVPCTGCRYCLPCPEGVNIPENLYLLNQAVWSGSAEKWMTKWYNELESDDPATDWHGKGAASRCTTCGECLEKCPQDIAIPDELEITRKVFENGLAVADLNI